MDECQKSENLRLWISYPWISKEERDFTYLVEHLKTADIEAVYDSLQLLPETPLCERTLQRLLSVGFDGWLYILTHQCFTRKTCTDELTSAIDQALRRMGPDFPMMGLLSGIATQQVPPVLRVRPCISLGDPDWKRQVSEALRRRTPRDKRGIVREETGYIWSIHACYCGDPSMTAVEVRAKGESIQYWRFAIPRLAQTVRWGQGPSGGQAISNAGVSEATGSGRYGSHSITWFGAANTIPNTESAYAVFSGPLPDFICFGSATSPFGPPGPMETVKTASLKQSVTDPA
jgi:hypothetical protein